ATGFNTSDKKGITAAQLNLGVLQNNGGPTATNALQSGSVAINTGDNNLVPSTVTTDQRGPGFVRIFDNIVDVGAFESQTVPSPPSPPSPPPSPGGGGGF